MHYRKEINLNKKQSKFLIPVSSNRSLSSQLTAKGLMEVPILIALSGKSIFVSIASSDTEWRGREKREKRRW